MSDIEKLEAALSLIDHLCSNVAWEDEPLYFDRDIETIDAALRAHLNLLKAIEDKRLAVVPVEKLSDQLCGVAEHTLRYCRLALQQDEDGSGFPLVDALTPCGYTIKKGEEEIHYIVDGLYFPFKEHIEAVDQQEILKGLEE